MQRVKSITPPGFDFDSRRILEKREGSEKYNVSNLPSQSFGVCGDKRESVIGNRVKRLQENLRSVKAWCDSGGKQSLE